MTKGWQGNFFEDFSIGQRIVCGPPRTVTAGDTALYIALTGDRTGHYCGPGRRVHPLVTFHTVFGQTVRHISLNAKANLGYAEIQWHAPVFEGDTLATELEIVGLKENSSGTTGIVWVRNLGRNQRDEPVLSFARWVMVKKRDAAPTVYRDTPVVPELAASVAASALDVTNARTLPRASGGHPWEAYAIGERIFHHDGVTIQGADHMSFTRLFQNTAKVHFDALATDGRPLVYGGVVISHGYAQSLNGLDGRYGIAAINAGAHANPVYAGDTLYTFTDVLEHAAVADGLGALRLRMVVVKNLDPTTVDRMEVQVEDPKRPGRKRHHPNVVLDLDYWELV